MQKLSIYEQILKEIAVLNRSVVNSSWRECVSITLHFKFLAYQVQFLLASLRYIQSPPHNK